MRISTDTETIRTGFRRTFLILALLLFASNSPAAQKKFRVGVLLWSSNIPGQVAMRRGLEQKASRINRKALTAGKPGVKLITRIAGDGITGIENQIAQMNEMINKRVDIIIVQPADNAALIRPLMAANKAKIPVVAFDQYISGGSLAAYRTSDNYQAGYLDGEYIASRFPGKKKIKLVLVEYPHVSSTVERVNGFLDALKDAGKKASILASYIAVEPVEGRAAAASILRDFPKKDSVDAVFTVNDGGGLAVVRRLYRAGRREIIVATVDGDPHSVKNIRAGRLTVIDSAQFCGPLGAEAMKAAYEILTGEMPPYHAVVPVFPVTKETLRLYPGWGGPIPREFRKPWKSRFPVWKGRIRIIRK